MEAWSKRRPTKVEYLLTDAAGVVLPRKREIVGKDVADLTIAQLIRKHSTELALQKRKEKGLSEDQMRVELAFIFRGVDVDWYPDEFSKRLDITRDEYFEYVFPRFKDIVAERLQPNPSLVLALEALKIECGILSNRSRIFNGFVLQAMKMDAYFPLSIGAEELGSSLKPLSAAYEYALSRIDIDPKKIAYVDDKPDNHIVPHKLGMLTVFVGDSRIVDSEHRKYIDRYAASPIGNIAPAGFIDLAFALHANDYMI